MVLFLLLAALAISPLAISAPTGASVTQVGTQERYQPSAGSVTTQGGNVTALNVSGEVVTSKWAGFWGNVSGSKVLADSGHHLFYKWTVSDLTDALVYATTGAVNDWSCSNIVPLYADDSLFGSYSFLIEGADSFNYTFTEQESVAIPKGCSEQSFNYTTTWQGGSQGTEFKTYAAKASAENVFVWVARVNPGKTSFKGGTVTADYQLLAGVTSETGTTTFYFYLELP